MIKVYLAYSDIEADLIIFNELSKHLKSTSIKNLCKITDKTTALISNTQINNTQKLVSDNDVIIALVSVDFLTEDKLMALVEETNVQQKKLLPVIARDCHFAEEPLFSSYLNNAIPHHNTLAELFKNNTNTSQVYMSIASEIRNFLLGDYSTVTLHSSLPFFIISIASFLLGCFSAVFVFFNTKQFVLTFLVLTLFMTITVMSLSRYFILSTKTKMYETIE